MAAISLFTPSVLDPQTLEALFVGERPKALLDDIAHRTDNAATTKERNHTLLVGPRGAGKTHLIALAYHRAANRIATEGLRVQQAWLPEDPWLIYSYESLLQAIVDGLDSGHQSIVDSGDERQLAAWLKAKADRGGPIVVYAENLDQILSAIGVEGQQRLRSFLQQHAALLIVATTTSLTRDLTGVDSPFYNFFTTTHLQPFTVAEAEVMLATVAHHRGDSDTAAYIEAGHATPRLAAIEHLAGGAPRMWATLTSTLNISELDDLVDLLLTRFDELTPYYQEQLGRLVPLQRRVVSTLAEADRPLNAKTIAGLLHANEKSISKTLSELKAKNWVKTVESPFQALVTDRRLSYYELCEPLVGVVFQLKNSRGEPVRLIVEFLKLWFSGSELSAVESRLEPSMLEYVTLARAELADGHAPLAQQLRGLDTQRGRHIVTALDELDRALAAAEQGDVRLVFSLPVAIRRAVEARFRTTELDDEVIRELRHYAHEQARAEFGGVASPEMEPWIQRAAAMASDLQGHRQLAQWHSSAWQFDIALATIEDLGCRPGADVEALVARSTLAVSYWSAGRVDEAVELGEQVVAGAVEVWGGHHLDTLTTRASLAVFYLSAGRVDEAVGLGERVAADSTEALGEHHPDTLAALAGLAISNRLAGCLEEAIRLGEQVVEGWVKVSGENEAETLRARTSLALTYRSAGRTAEAINLARKAIDSLTATVGADHPATVYAQTVLEDTSETMA